MTATPDSGGKPAPPKPFYKQRWIVVTTAVVLFLILWANAWTAWYEQSTKGSEAPVSLKIVSPEKGVVALAWLEQGSIEGRVRLWVLFENRSDTHALGLRFLTVQTPGYSRIGNCWTAEGPACISPAPHLLKQPLPKGLPSTLERDQTVSVSALLEKSGAIESGPLAASGVFTWRDSRGERENAFVVPAVPVVSRFYWLWFGLGKSVLFLKDLLVPAALAYLGWYLQHRDKQRDAQAAQEKLAREAEERDQERRRAERAAQEKLAREAAERDQERRRAEREKEQARVRETWNLMLPRCHANAEQHYMPLAAAITDLLGTAWKIHEGSTDEEWHLLLWKLLRVLRLVRHLAHSIGGFYFRSIEGEELAGACWDQFLFLTRERLGQGDQERALTALEPQEGFASFKDKLTGRSAEPSLQGLTRSIFNPASREVAGVLSEIDAKLRCWAGEERGLQRNLPLLELFNVILRYEMNRPYEIWYGEQARFDGKIFRIALERLAPEHEKLRERLQNYLETAEQREST